MTVPFKCKKIYINDFPVLEMGYPIYISRYIYGSFSLTLTYHLIQSNLVLFVFQLYFIYLLVYCITTTTMVVVVVVVLMIRMLLMKEVVEFHHT